MAELPFLDESTAAAPAVPFSGIVGTLDANSFETKSNKGSPNGYAPLDSNSRVPIQNLPANLEYLTNKNAANGYAGLGADGKISLSLLPDANALESEAIAFAIALG